jgi:transcriptional regulator with XRE-family HTH domain
MRPSACKQPLAVLRKIIGYRQKEMADLIGCSVATIQSIELGPKRMALSERLAERIEMETGVSIEWLLSGDPLEPIEDVQGRVYSRKTFELYQRLKISSDGADDDMLMRQWFEVCLAFGEMLLAGREQKRTSLTVFRIREALRRINQDLKLPEDYKPGHFAYIINSLGLFEPAIWETDSAERFAKLLSSMQTGQSSATPPDQSQTTSAHRPQKRVRGKTRK